MNRPPAWHQESQQRTGNPAAPRRGSVKRVASAVGEGAISIPLVHRWLDTKAGARGRR